MVQNLPHKLRSKDTDITPAGNNLFKNGNGNSLGKSQAEDFHKMVAKAMFLSKRARHNIQPIIAVLTTRVIPPNIIDCNKFVRSLKYLNGKKKYHLTLSIDGKIFIKWYVETSFSVHPDLNSHTGGIMM